MKLPDAWEKYRIRNGRLASDPADGCNGAFFVPHEGIRFTVIVSDGAGWKESLPGEPWEHASLTLWSHAGDPIKRCPRWSEMCWLKEQLWGDDETVIQLHPPRNEHINNHPYCLHLWKPPYVVALPPGITVGFGGSA